MKVSLLVILVTIYLQNSVDAQQTICAVGYKFNGSECVASTDNSLILQQPCNSCANKCPTGYVFRDNACYPSTCIDGSPVVNGRCTSTTTTTVICPEHSVWTGGKCIKTSYGSLICEDGYTFQNGKCVSSHQERPICTSGTYDITLKKCTQVVQKQCPSGSSNAPDGSCTSTETATIICQPGYHIEGNVCVTKTKQECIGGVWEYGNCVTKKTKTTIVKCPYGFIETNGECQKRGIAETVCPQNSYYDGTQCKLQGSLSCPSDYSLRGNRCVKTEEVFIEAYCPTGYNNEGHYCVKYIPANLVCAIGILENNYCVVTQQPEISCEYGYTLDSFTNMCTQIITIPVHCYGNGATLIGEYCVNTLTPQCLSGYILYGDVCQRTTIVAPICTVPSVPFGNSCVITSIELPKCPITYNLDLVNGNCFKYSVEPPVCEAGYDLVSEQCIKIEVVPVTCPTGYTYNEVDQNCNLTTIIVVPPQPTTSSCGQTPCGQTPCGGGCSKGSSGCTNTNTNTITISNIVNNNNTVSVPTNIHSTNINNISVPKPVEKAVIEKPIEEKCCTIITPRQCTQESGRWNCEHKKYSRCGSFCRQSQMFLRPVETTYRNNMLVMPPPPRRLPSRHYGHLGK